MENLKTALYESSRSACLPSCYGLCDESTMCLTMCKHLENCRSATLEIYGEIQ